MTDSFDSCRYNAAQRAESKQGSHKWCVFSYATTVLHTVQISVNIVMRVVRHGLSVCEGIAKTSITKKPTPVYGGIDIAAKWSISFPFGSMAGGCSGMRPILLRPKLRK